MILFKLPSFLNMYVLVSVVDFELFFFSPSRDFGPSNFFENSCNVIILIPKIHFHRVPGANFGEFISIWWGGIFHSKAQWERKNAKQSGPNSPGLLREIISVAQAENQFIFPFLSELLLCLNDFYNTFIKIDVIIKFVVYLGNKAAARTPFVPELSISKLGVGAFNVIS